MKYATTSPCAIPHKTSQRLFWVEGVNLNTEVVCSQVKHKHGVHRGSLVPYEIKLAPQTGLPGGEGINY